MVVFFGDIRFRDIGMIELFIVDKKVIRDDICFQDYI